MQSIRNSPYEHWNKSIQKSFWLEDLVLTLITPSGERAAPWKRRKEQGCIPSAVTPNAVCVWLPSIPQPSIEVVGVLLSHMALNIPTTDMTGRTCRCPEICEPRPRPLQKVSSPPSILVRGRTTRGSSIRRWSRFQQVSHRALNGVSFSS